jgi:hypothetical protein
LKASAATTEVVTPAARPPKLAAATITRTNTSATFVLSIVERSGTIKPATAIAVSAPSADHILAASLVCSGVPTPPISPDLPARGTRSGGY